MGAPSGGQTGKLINPDIAHPILLYFLADLFDHFFIQFPGDFVEILIFILVADLITEICIEDGSYGIFRG